MRYKYLIIKTFFVLNSFALTLDHDSLKPCKNFIEVKAGLVYYLIGGNQDAPKEPQDRIYGLPAETFNFCYGRKFKKLSIGLNIDYTHLRMSGNAKPVGTSYTTYQGQQSYVYVIRQIIDYKMISSGFTVMYNLQFEKFRFSFGPSVYYMLYLTTPILSNIYSGPQNNYPNKPLPQAEKKFKAEVCSDVNDATLPNIGFNISFGYALNKKITLNLHNSIMYDADVRNAACAFGALPKSIIYDISTQFWLNSGISCMYQF